MTGALYRLGCDIGGTFTDFVRYDAATGRIDSHKVLTTPEDPSAAVETGVADLGQSQPGYLAATEHMIHGTTLVINAVIERKGAPTAVIATRGFRDVLEMRREVRYDIYDIGAAYPAPFVARPERREVRERMRADGTVLEPLDEADGARVLAELAASGIQSVAVCLLHAYANPAHELGLARIASRVAPGLSLSLSAEVLPEIREFERTATTVVNAYVKPLIDRYVARLEERLRTLGLPGGLFLMLSGGGIAAPATARRFPVRLIESGPVGGVLAAADLGRLAGVSELIAFDMGGTTAKACLVQGGEPLITTDYEVDRVHRFKKGSGTPVAVPTVDMIEIGAGGGSIARVNALGLLQVGPESAGAAPGPICYGRGGTQPTVTDADLVLGYLDPDYFLGGSMALERDAAAAGIDRAVGAPLGLTTLQAAFGIREVVNENMAAAVRAYVAEKGGRLDGATLVAFGGAGPLHAAGVAARLGVRRLLVPRAAGVFSALGFLVAPVSFEVARTRVMRLDALDTAALGALVDALGAEATAVVRQAVKGAPVTCRAVLDMCYAGQGSTLRLGLGDLLAGPAPAAAIRARFLAEYRRRYGYAYEDLPVQIVTTRVTATARQELPPVAMPFKAVGEAAEACVGTRPAYAASVAAMVNHAVYRLDRLPAGAAARGPAIIEDVATTLVVDDGWLARIDGRGWIDLVLEGGEP